MIFLLRFLCHITLSSLFIVSLILITLFSSFFFSSSFFFLLWRLRYRLASSPSFSSFSSFSFPFPFSFLSPAPSDILPTAFFALKPPSTGHIPFLPLQSSCTFSCVYFHTQFYPSFPLSLFLLFLSCLQTSFQSPCHDNVRWIDANGIFGKGRDTDDHDESEYVVYKCEYEYALRVSYYNSNHEYVHYERIIMLISVACYLAAMFTTVMRAILKSVLRYCKTDYDW